MSQSHAEQWTGSSPELAEPDLNHAEFWGSLLDNNIAKRLANTDVGIQKGALAGTKGKKEHGHFCLAFQFL